MSDEGERLLAAIRRRDMQAAESLVHAGAPIDSQTLAGLLATAASVGHEDLVKAIVARAPALETGHAVSCALMTRGREAEAKLRIVRYLLAHTDPTPPPLERPDGRTWRMAAFSCAQLDALPLLSRFPVVKLTDAAIDADEQAVRRFLSEGASPDEVDLHGSIRPLRCATRVGSLAVMELLLDAGASASVGKPWDAPVLAALEGAHLDCAQRAWDAGSRADDLLSLAIRHRCSVAALEWVFEREPGSDLRRAARSSISMRDVAILELLGRRGLTLRPEGSAEDLLMSAAYVRFAAGVQWLIARGADVRAADSSGYTALHYAICRDEIYDPDVPFSYLPSALEQPTARLLLAAGGQVPNDGRVEREEPSYED